MNKNILIKSLIHFKINRTYYLLLLLLFSISCRNDKKKINVTVKYRNDSIIINAKNWSSPIILFNENLDNKYCRNTNPIYFVDSVEKIIFLYNPSYKVLCIDIESKNELCSLEIIGSKKECEYSLVPFKDNIIFKSNCRLLLLDKKLNIKFNYIDSLKVYYPKIGETINKFSYFIKNDSIILNVWYNYDYFENKTNNNLKMITIHDFKCKKTNMIKFSTPTP